MTCLNFLMFCFLSVYMAHIWNLNYEKNCYYRAQNPLKYTNPPPNIFVDYWKCFGRWIYSGEWIYSDTTTVLDNGNLLKIMKLLYN